MRCICKKRPEVLRMDALYLLIFLEIPQNGTEMREIDPGFLSIMGATDRVSLRLSRRFDAKARKPLRYRCNPTGQQRKFKRTRGLNSDWLLFRLDMLIRCYR